MLCFFNLNEVKNYKYTVSDIKNDPLFTSLLTPVDNFIFSVL